MQTVLVMADVPCLGWDCSSLADGPRRHAARYGSRAITCAREYTCSVVALSRKRRAALPALDCGALIGFPLGVPDAPSAPARASSGVRGVGAGRSAARAPGGAPRSPARHARCIHALARVAAGR